MNTSTYFWTLKHIVPYIRFSTYYPSLRGAKYQEGYALLKTGHIVLTNDSKKLTALLIPGIFAHAALCVRGSGDASHFEIAEMTHTDYTKSYFFDLCKEADHVVIIECVDFDAKYARKVAKKCAEFEDAVYDVKFDFGVKALYCSELVYQADFEHRLDVNLEDLAGLGRDYISPTGLYKAKNIRVVWDSDKSNF